ncbi:hypothetical protein V6N13_068207 [Hibiscus sabdariffa]
MICYTCGKYGHSKELCGKSVDVAVTESLSQQEVGLTDEFYGPWVQVSYRKRSVNLPQKDSTAAKRKLGGVVFEVPPVVTSRPPVLPSPLPPPSAAAACSMHVGTSAQGSFVAISPQSTDHVSIQSHSLEVHSNNVNNVMFPVALVEEVVQGNTPLISSKGVARKEMKSKKKGDRISSKPSLINLVNVISLELDKVAATASKQVAPSPSISAVGVDEVQWRENSTFTVTENVDM